MNFYIVKYNGHFGFIKPWTAVRDSETYSQQFLTPSIVEGIEKKLFPELLDTGSNPTKGISKIKRHRLSYFGLSIQQERTWSKGGLKISKDKKKLKTNLSIIDRGVMIEPILYLAFSNMEDATTAAQQHICLCRNEDVMYPDENIEEIIIDDFNNYEGFELVFDGDESNMFKVGYNRYNDAKEMYGELKVFGNPIRQSII